MKVNVVLVFSLFRPHSQYEFNNQSRTRLSHHALLAISESLTDVVSRVLLLYIQVLRSKLSSLSSLFEETVGHCYRYFQIRDPFVGTLVIFVRFLFRGVCKFLFSSQTLAQRKLRNFIVLGLGRRTERTETLLNG